MELACFRRSSSESDLARYFEYLGDSPPDPAFVLKQLYKELEFHPIFNPDSFRFRARKEVYLVSVVVVGRRGGRSVGILTHADWNRSIFPVTHLAAKLYEKLRRRKVDIRTERAVLRNAELKTREGILKLTFKIERPGE